ncbi:hypothetical protein LDENG_00187380, partial [Lucifuga dentata]
MMDYLSQEHFKYQQVDFNTVAYQNELKPIAVWKVGKTFLIHCSSSMLWEMIVSNITCMQNGQYAPLIHQVKSYVNPCGILCRSF